MPHFTHDGHQLFYREQGSGPLLLILPGNTASSASHAGELAYFGQRYRTVSLDFRGTGQSDRLAEWPDDWWEISGGAIVALLMAILHPERVRGVIADSTVQRFRKSGLKEAVAERAERTSDQVTFWLQAHGEDWEEVVDADSAMLLRFARKQKGDAFQGRLSEIECPVLLTASLEDPRLPKVGKQIMAMSQQIRNSRAFLTSQGGHPLMWSRPEDFRHVADYFLMRLQELDAQKGNGS